MARKANINYYVQKTAPETREQFILRNNIVIGGNVAAFLNGSCGGNGTYHRGGIPQLYKDH